MKNPFKKNLKLDLYTCDNGYYVNDKPDKKADQASWWKNLKNTVKFDDAPSRSSFELGTAKNCPGIRNLMTEGIKFRLWEHLKLRIMPDGKVEQLPLGFQSKDEPFVQHYPPQFEGLYPKNACAFKLNTPWLGRCSEDVDFLFMESHYSDGFFREHNAYIAPGYINFKYQHSLNCHIIIPTEEEPYEIELPYGLPLFTIYPITKRELEIEHHLVSYDKYRELTSEFPMCPYRKYFTYVKKLTGNE